jgi:hypothetical protein
VEGVARVVCGRAVELEDQRGFRPVGVHLVAGHVDVELRLGKVVVVAERLEAALRLAAQKVRLGLVSGQDADEPVPPLAAGQPRLHRLDRPEIEDPQQLGLAYRPGQLPIVEDIGEVNEGASDAGGGDAVDLGAVVGVDHAGAVQRDTSPPPSTRCGHVDARRSPAQQSMLGPSAAVTQQRSLPTGVNSGDEVRLTRQRGMPDRVHTAVQRDQPLPLHSRFHRGAAHAQLEQLRQRNDAMLPASELPDRLVPRVIVSFPAILSGNVDHAPRVPGVV